MYMFVFQKGSRDTRWLTCQGKVIAEGVQRNCTTFHILYPMEPSLHAGEEVLTVIEYSVSSFPVGIKVTFSAAVAKKGDDTHNEHYDDDSESGDGASGKENDDDDGASGKENDGDDGESREENDDDDDGASGEENDDDDVASSKENDDDDGVSGVRRKSAKRPDNLTTRG